MTRTPFLAPPTLPLYQRGSSSSGTEMGKPCQRGSGKGQRPLRAVLHLMVDFHHKAVKWLPCRTLSSFLQCQEIQSPSVSRGQMWHLLYVFPPTAQAWPRNFPQPPACPSHPHAFFGKSFQFHFSLGGKAFLSSETISNNFLSIHPTQFHTAHKNEFRSTKESSSWPSEY